jgi:hypothetical protein
MQAFPRASNELARVAQHHARSLGWMARAGYVTRAFLYFIIGGLAALAAFGYGGDTTDSKGAITELYRQPFGQTLLVLAAIGLCGYAAFQIHQALLDRETAQRGVHMRIAAGFGALIHLGLAVYAVRLIGGTTRQSSGERDTRAGTAEVLAWEPVGPWLVAGLAVTLLIVSGFQLWCAWRAKLDDQLDLSSVGAGSRRWLVAVSRVGIAARAVVGMIAGTFLLVAALTSDPQQAKGFGASLSLVREAPFGGALFALVALGLMAFAFYQLIEARYRRVAGQTP